MPSLIRLPILATTVFLVTSLPAAADSDDARRYFGQVEGRVVTTDGLPLLGAEVGLDPLVIKTVSTDSEGRFTLRAVPEGSYRVIAAAPGFTPGEVSIELSRESPPPELLIRLRAAEVTLDSIDVVGSYSIGRDAPASSSALTAEELRELPHFGDDIVRAVTVLPGVTSNDASAEFNVRGSLTREVRYEIDGLEIFEPYHLKDYQGIFSIIDPEMLGGVDLFTGGFPVEYGDRSAGVLDLETFSPDGRAHEVGISLLNAWGSTSGRWEGGSYFASARRGWLDVVLEIVGDEEEEDRSLRLRLDLREAAGHLEERRDAGRIVERAVVDAVAFAGRIHAQVERVVRLAVDELVPIHPVDRRAVTGGDQVEALEAAALEGLQAGSRLSCPAQHAVGCRCRVAPVAGVAAVEDAVAAAPLVH